MEFVKFDLFKLEFVRMKVLKEKGFLSYVEVVEKEGRFKVRKYFKFEQVVDGVSVVDLEKLEVRKRCFVDFNLKVEK